MQARRLAHAGYQEMPWRNGGGSTREIAREPAAGADFAWRLSLATVAISGPFSLYSGYDRVVALASGAGFVLTVGAAPPVRLAAPGEHLKFSGDAATGCELIQGPATDVSLMVRRPGAILIVERLELGQRPLPLPQGAPLAALVCLEGRCRCTPQASAAVELDRFDTLLLEGEGAISAAAGDGGAARLLLLGWRVAAETPKIR